MDKDRNHESGGHQRPASLSRMPSNGIIPWESLERSSSKLFLLGAVILAFNAGIVFYDVIEGTELRLPLGQVFVGTGWAAAPLGTLGVYPDLADRRP